MKRFFLMVIAVGLMVPAGAYAQAVYKNTGNQVILDLTTATGMPAGAVTDEAKYTSFTPSASEEGANNKQYESINARVFQKLEVARHDLSGEGVVESSGGSFTWVNAFNYCKAIGTGWRLPTQRELTLIYIFRPALEKIFEDEAINGTAFSSANYWSSTESQSSNYSVVGDFANGYSMSHSKADASRARCVREVTD